MFPGCVQDFDNPKVYGDTSITDGLVKFAVLNSKHWPPCAVQAQAAVSAAGADEVAKAEAMIAVEVPGLIFIISFLSTFAFQVCR